METVAEKPKFEWWKVRHFFRDLFKPRYALVVELHNMPNLESMFDATKKPYLVVPVIMRVPYKRPFFMPYNRFVNGMKKAFGIQTLIFFGSKRTLMNLEGIGSVLPHNMKNAVTWDYEYEKS